MKKVLVLGSDGYIGTGLVQRLLFNDYIVCGVDNEQRRKAVKEMGSFSAVPIKSLKERTKILKDMGDYMFFKLDITNYEGLRDIFKLFKPDIIMNLAHQPSAPYSQIDYNHAYFSLNNNIIGTLNVIYCMKEISPDAHLVQIGTTGEYNPNINTDIAEGTFQFEFNGRTSNTCLFPRQAGSMYHWSKICSTYGIETGSRFWGLTCTDIMQGVVFGNYTSEIEKTGLNTRLDSDECLVPNTKILTNNGYRNIEDIKIDDYVYSHSGNCNKVTKLFSRYYHGEMIKIKPYYFDEFTITPNHPILIIKRERNHDSGYNFYKEPRWMNAKNLFESSQKSRSNYNNVEEIVDKYEKSKNLRENGKTYKEISEILNVKYTTICSWLSRNQKPMISLNNDKEIKDLFLLIPKIKDSFKEFVINLNEEIGYGVVNKDKIYTINPANENKIWGSGIKNFINIDSNFCSLVGYYLGEGYGSSNSYMVGICFGDEEELSSDCENLVLEVFGKNSSVIDRREKNEKRISVNIHSTIINKLFTKLFGKNSHEKNLPEWFYEVDKKYLKYLIKNYWLCDGNGKNSYYAFTSVSKKLLEQLQYILLRKWGIISSINGRIRTQLLSFKDREPYEFSGETFSLNIQKGFSSDIFSKEILDIQPTEVSRPTQWSYNLDNYIAIPIKNIEKTEYNGYVYNLEVENDNSYILPIIVHNCHGTIINRFIVQAVLGRPLTIFGKGLHKRGFLAINDSVQCLMLAMENPPNKGEYRTWNQLDETYSIEEIANKVLTVAKEFGFSGSKTYINSPRVECLDDHYYNPIIEKLPELGFKPTRTVEDEIRYVFKLLLPIKDSIEGLKDVIMPKIRW